MKSRACLSTEEEVIDRGEYLYVRVSGLLRHKQDQLDYLNKLVAVYDEHRPARVIIDEREVDSRLKLVDIYSSSREYGSVLPPEIRRMKVAVVSRGQSPGRLKFWEDVSFNRGFNFRGFLAVEEAEEWLHGK